MSIQVSKTSLTEKILKQPTFTANKAFFCFKSEATLVNSFFVYFLFIYFSLLLAPLCPETCVNCLTTNLPPFLHALSILIEKDPTLSVDYIISFLTSGGHKAKKRHDPPCRVRKSLALH